MTPGGPGYDIWVDFNDIYDYNSVVTHIDAESYVEGAKPTLGQNITAGDGEGNRCPAVVTAVEGTRVFQAATTTPPTERDPE